MAAPPQRAPDTVKRTAVFRPEIEGLRAIAATLVMTFHIWLGRVSGGVDVFFVVSSFLITTALLGQIQRTGKIQFAQFWAGLIKRLLPLAYFVLCIVMIASVVLLPKSRWMESIQEIAASALYVENWTLAFKSIDYLARSAVASPVQHFWALSTQGQFYIAWPLLFALALYASRRLRLAHLTVITGVLGAIFVASLIYSVILTRTDQPFAYFNSLARTWEFCLGALLAIVLPHLRLSTTMRVAAGWIGVLAILSCGLVFQVSRVFPGYLALWPTLGAALVVAAGTSGSKVGVDRILSSRPLVFLGGISYGIYLWHFPLLVFMRTFAEPQRLDPLIGIWICIASVLLAYLSSRLLENPARHTSIGTVQPAAAFSFGAICLLIVFVGVGAWEMRYAGVRSHELTSIAVGDPDHPGAAAMRAGFRYRGAKDAPIFPGAFQVKLDWDKYYERCDPDVMSTRPVPCRGGAEKGTMTIAMVGASHVDQWSMPLEKIAQRNGWRLLNYTKNSCPFYAGAASGIFHRGACDDWNAKLLEELIRVRPDWVFTTSTRPGDKLGDQVPAGYVAAWEKLAAAGIPVVAIRDNPDFGFDVSACVELHGANSPRCARSRDEVISPSDPTRRIQHLAGHIKFIDLSDYFCDTTLCRPVIGNVLVYRHGAHITATYAMSLAPMLDAKLRSVLQ